MLLLTFTIIAIAILGSWFLLLYSGSPPGGAAAGDDEQMTMWDWVWIGTATTISLIIAVFFTIKLSSRILTR
jgi:two-component system sensor histidine kinase AdeS